MDLGTDLRSARERAGISLPELFARTRIPLKSLRAIEENDFSTIPAGIFVRSYIRQYAREVGVDPTAAIAEYRAITEPTEEPTVESIAATVDEHPREPEFVPDLRESGPRWGHVLVAAALMVGLIGLNRYAGSGSTDVIAATPPHPVAASPAAASPVAASPVAAKEEAQPVATIGTGIRIEINAQGLCWIRAVADDQFAFARLLQPGETETLTARRDITVRVGDPASFSYSINGNPGQPLGVANVPVTVRFGTDGRVSRVS